AAHGAVDGDAHVVRRDGAVPGAGPHGPTSVAVKETSLARLPRPSSASTTSLENFSTTTLSTPCPTDHSTGPSVHVTCGRATTSARWTASVHAAAPAGGVAVTVDRRRPSMPVTRLPLDCVPTRPPVTSCHRTTTRAPASRAVASCAEAVTDLPVHCGGLGHAPTSTAARFPNAADGFSLTIAPRPRRPSATGHHPPRPRSREASCNVERSGVRTFDTCASIVTSWYGGSVDVSSSSRWSTSPGATPGIEISHDRLARVRCTRARTPPPMLV